MRIAKDLKAGAKSLRWEIVAIYYAYHGPRTGALPRSEEQPESLKNKWVFAFNFILIKIIISILFLMAIIGPTR